MSIKGRQVAGVTTLVVFIVAILSAFHLATLARLSLAESQSRGDLLLHAIFQRAREVAPAAAAEPNGASDPDAAYLALQGDGGIRSLLESSMGFAGNVTYAAIINRDGVAVAHSLNPAALRPYFQWRRDRLISIVAIAAVLLLGVLDGLLAAIGVSLLLLLQGFSRTTVSWLGRLGLSHDYVDAARHPEATVPPGVLIARPEVPLFFGNAEAVFASIRSRIDGAGPLQRFVLSLEESPDLDATSIEALCDFAAFVRARGAELALARVKDGVRDLLARVHSPDLPAAVYASWSVDDAVH